jgi:hypothetical protein
MGETIMGELDGPTAERQSRHAEIISAIGRLKRAKDSMQNLLSEVTQAPVVTDESAKEKKPLPSLSAFLVEAPGAISEITDALNSIRDQLNEALF